MPTILPHFLLLGSLSGFELPQFSQCVVRVRPMTGANPRAAFAKKPLTTRHPAPDQGSIVCGCRQVLDLLCVLVEP